MTDRNLPKTRCPQCNKKMEHPDDADIITDDEKILKKYFTCDNCGSVWEYDAVKRKIKRVIS